MANTNTPFGLKPVKYHDGSPWNSAVNLYFIPSSDTNAYYIGDVVQGVAGGDPQTGLPAVTLYGTRGAGSTAGATRGVVVGFATAVSTPGGNLVGGFDPNNLAIVYVPATKAYGYYVYVVDDPAVIYEVQCDSGNFVAANYGKNAGLTIGLAPTAPQNQSTTVLTTASIAATATLPVKIFGGPNRPDNDLVSATNPYAKAYVTLNTADYGAGVNGTAGY